MISMHIYIFICVYKLRDYDLEHHFFPALKKEEGVKALSYNFEHAAFTRTLLGVPEDH